MNDLADASLNQRTLMTTKNTLEGEQTYVHMLESFGHWREVWKDLQQIGIAHIMTANSLAELNGS